MLKTMIAAKKTSIYLNFPVFFSQASLGDDLFVRYRLYTLPEMKHFELLEQQSATIDFLTYNF